MTYAGTVLVLTSSSSLLSIDAILYPHSEQPCVVVTKLVLDHQRRFARSREEQIRAIVMEAIHSIARRASGVRSFFHSFETDTAVVYKSGQPNTHYSAPLMLGERYDALYTHT